MRTFRLRIALECLAAFGLLLLSACSASSRLGKEAWTIRQTSGLDLQDEGIRLPFPSGNPSSPVVFWREKNRLLPTQADDVNGDGAPDELFVLADLPANEKVTLELQNGAPAAAPPARTQVVFKTQNIPFQVAKARELAAPYQQRRMLEVPADLTPQNMWVMFEGPVWENDKVAYRFYLDDRYRTDIYAKKVPDLVMDTVGWNYHEISDWGADILKVGESLGIGSPAIWYKGKAQALSKSAGKQLEVVASGPLRNLLRTNFRSLQMDDLQLDLSCEMEMHAGHYWTEVRLKPAKLLPGGMGFATGLVKHPAAGFKSGKVGQVSYGYTWGKQSYHDQLLGMAILVENDFLPEFREDAHSHLLVLKPKEQGVRYRFLAIWEEDTSKIKTEEAFKQFVEQECRLWQARPSLEMK